MQRATGGGFPFERKILILAPYIRCDRNILFYISLLLLFLIQFLCILLITPPRLFLNTSANLLGNICSLLVCTNMFTDKEDYKNKTPGNSRGNTYLSFDISRITICVANCIISACVLFSFTNVRICSLS